MAAVAQMGRPLTGTVWAESMFFDEGEEDVRTTRRAKTCPAKASDYQALVSTPAPLQGVQAAVPAPAKTTAPQMPQRWADMPMKDEEGADLEHGRSSAEEAPRAAPQEVDDSKERAKRAALAHLFVYTMSSFAFGVSASALGPTIPWLAQKAGVSHAEMGWLPLAQMVTCIVSGLASGLVSKVPRKYHHGLLCCLVLWLGVGFAFLPIASGSHRALTVLFGLQVLPRPWIGQMTNLLVSQLHEDASTSSVYQSINQGGFALGCAATQLLHYAMTQASSDGTANFFYCAGCLTAISGFLFCLLPTLSERPEPQVKQPASPAVVQTLSEVVPTFSDRPQTQVNRDSAVPSCSTVPYALLGILGVGVEVACGTWLITCLLGTGLTSELATVIQLVFWFLFAASRLVIAPFFIWLFDAKPLQVIIVGSVLAAVYCVPASIWPHVVGPVMGAVGTIAVCLGPSYAMTISMAKQRAELTSADSALFSVAASIGAGGVPFVQSRILHVFGPRSFFPALGAMSLAMLPLALLLAPRTSKRSGDEPLADEYDLEAVRMPGGAEKSFSVPPVVWMWWEQGWATAPLLCQACAESWKTMNPEVQVRKLDRSNLASFLPQLSLSALEWLPPTQRSDLVRLALLDAYGGVWADSTLFCTGPVMPWLQDLQTGSLEEDFFFVYDRSDMDLPLDPFSQAGLLISSWFIATSPRHPLCSAWLRHYDAAIRMPTTEYFAVHGAFRDLVAEDERMLALYSKMPKVSASHPHLLEFSLGFTSLATEPAEAEALQVALQRAPMQKLSRKVLDDLFFAQILSSDELPQVLLGSLFTALGNEELASFRQRAREAATSPSGRAAKASDLRSLQQQEADAKDKVYSSWCLQFSVEKAGQGSN
jgi:fucose permease